MFSAIQIVSSFPQINGLQPNDSSLTIFDFNVHLPKLICVKHKQALTNIMSFPCIVRCNNQKDGIRKIAAKCKLLPISSNSLVFANVSCSDEMVMSFLSGAMHNVHWDALSNLSGCPAALQFREGRESEDPRCRKL